MGENLVLAAISTKTKTSLKQREKRMLKALEKATLDELKDYAYEALGFDGMEEVKGNGKLIRKEAKDTVKQFTEIFTKDARGATIFEYPERTVYIAGGSTWGDDPCWEFTVLSGFRQLPDKVLKAGGWSW